MTIMKLFFNHGREIWIGAIVYLRERERDENNFFFVKHRHPAKDKRNNFSYPVCFQIGWPRDSRKMHLRIQLLLCMPRLQKLLLLTLSHRKNWFHWRKNLNIKVSAGPKAIYMYSITGSIYHLAIKSLKAHCIQLQWIVHSVIKTETHWEFAFGLKLDNHNPMNMGVESPIMKIARKLYSYGGA